MGLRFVLACDGSADSYRAQINLEWIVRLDILQVNEIYVAVLWLPVGVPMRYAWWAKRDDESACHGRI